MVSIPAGSLLTLILSGGRQLNFSVSLATLLLLGVAMPLKYFADWPLGVRVVGMAHGVLFMLYVLAAIQTALDRDWSWKRTAIVLAASLVPAGPFVVEAKMLKAESEKELKGEG